MAKLINGNGNPAIYAAEDADLIASLAGNVTCIANVGNKYAATEEDATTIRLDDGVIITKEGRRIQLEAGESDTFYIPTGTSDQTNYYIIGYKLVQNADSTQVAEQFVQKMNSSSETITEDTFRSGATEVYVSVYRVTQVGFTIDSISGLLPELLDNASIKDNIDQINSDLINLRKDYTLSFNTNIADKGNFEPMVYEENGILHFVANKMACTGSNYIVADGLFDCFTFSGNPLNLELGREYELGHCVGTDVASQTLSQFGISLICLTNNSTHLVTKKSPAWITFNFEVKLSI